MDEWFEIFFEDKSAGLFHIRSQWVSDGGQLLPANKP
jgi:hypothetical protein